jgi:SAM-dependent methyltransferase
VVGVDVSEEMLQVARRRGAEEGLRNVVFERGDAQVHAFPESHFDLCVSRFGAMFFADPVAAFSNIGRAMRPGAHLVLLVWQGRERNEWATAIQGALGLGDVGSANTPPTFSLGDRAAATRILIAAGFVSIDFSEVHEPVFYGPSIDAAQEAIVELFLAGEPPGERGPALRALLEAHLADDGVFFDSRAWIVTGRTRGEPEARR